MAYHGMSKSKRRAFSLIEILFAVFITAAVAALLAATMPIATSSRVKADLNNKATTLAQKEMEAVRGLGYANLTASSISANGLIDSTSAVSANTYAFTNVDGASKDSPATVLPEGKGFITITQPDIDLRAITVEVTYRQNGRTQSVKLSTLVANL